MTQPFDELLSAYHDEETSPEERTRIEKGLADSPELQAQLGKHQQLSSLLADLPPERLPQEFPSQVLHTAERETLLPVAPVADPLPRQRGWGVIAGSLIASAAALLLMVKLVDNPDSNIVVDVPVHESKGDAPNVASLGEKKSSPASDDLTKDTDKLVLNENKVGRPERANDQPGLGGGDTVAKNPAVEALVEDESGLVPPTIIPGLSAGMQLSILGDTRAEPVGELVAALETPANHIAVVRLSVDNQWEGLNALQTLLSRNRIALSPPESDIEVARHVEKQRKANAGYEAVYVEADADRLNAVLTELNREKSFQSVEVAESFAVDRLDRASQRIVLRNNLRSGFKADAAAAFGGAAAPVLPGEGTAAARYSLKPTAKPSADTKRQASKPADKTLPPRLKRKKLLAGEGKSTSNKKAKDSRELKGFEKNGKKSSPADELDRISQQLQLSLPRTVFEQLAKRPAEFRQRRSSAFEQADSATVPAPTAPVPSDAADEAEKAVLGKRRQLQVLFLLVPRKQPAAPSLKKAAAPPQR